MKELILIYSKKCIESQVSLSLVNEILSEYTDACVKLIEFSFEEPVIKNLNVFITPTFIIENKIAFVGTPEKENLISKLL